MVGEGRGREDGEEKGRGEGEEGGELGKYTSLAVHFSLTLTGLSLTPPGARIALASHGHKDQSSLELCRTCVILFTFVF